MLLASLRRPLRAYPETQATDGVLAVEQGRDAPFEPFSDRYLIINAYQQIANDLLR